PPTRKNVFDADVDIAELARSDDTKARGKLHLGRADPDATADAVLADRTQHTSNKAAILSALATFDSDDDERDDTYDEADVGGTVDSVVPSSTDAEAGANAKARNAAAEEADLALFRAYRSNPALFGRDAATRRSQPRASLKRDTGMTDEALEGWAIMLSRDPRRTAKLEDKLALAAGGSGSGEGGLVQPHLPSTAYRKPGPTADGPDEKPESAARGRGGGPRGRGRGGRRGGSDGGRGGGPSADPNSAASRQRKEENKASKANHNRRQQRAKKIARGGGMLG
ncbi:CUE domain protein, partial [Aspergillus sp. HF37]